MEWLLTVKKVDPADLDALLRQLGCERDPEHEPIPLGRDEEAISVHGPRDLATRAQGEEQILKVSPNSTLTLY